MKTELQDLIMEAMYAANAAEHTEWLAWSIVTEGDAKALECARRASQLVGETRAQLDALRRLQGRTPRGMPL